MVEESDFQPEIVLPYWRTSVSVGEIPGLIATALYPQDQLTITRLHKTNGTVEVPLTEEDYKLVHSLRPPYRDGMSGVEFRAFEAAFGATGADFRLVPYCVGRSDAWAMACAEHEERLQAAVLSGTVPVYSVAREPPSMTRGLPAEPQDQILVESFTYYAADLGIHVRVYGAVINKHIRLGEAARVRAEGLAQEARAPRGQFERKLLDDIQRLADAGAIRPRIDTHGTLAEPGRVDPNWYLNLRDLDKLEYYNRCRDPQRKEQHLQELIGYRASGRYTLSQAAECIAIEGGERYDDVLNRLTAAALTDELPMYAPGRNLRTPRDHLAGREQARWNELNAWMEEYEPHVIYRFPDPGVAKQPGTALKPTTARGAALDRKLTDMVQAYERLYAKERKEPSQRAIAEATGYDRSTVQKRWPQIQKTSQNQPKPAKTSQNQPRKPTKTNPAPGRSTEYSHSMAARRGSE